MSISSDFLFPILTALGYLSLYKNSSPENLAADMDRQAGKNMTRSANVVMLDTCVLCDADCLRFMVGEDS